MHSPMPEAEAGSSVERGRAASMLGDASLLLALLTLVVYASGFSWAQAYDAHWVLPAGDPPSDVPRFLEHGLEASAAFSILFLVWVAYATDPKPPKNRRLRTTVLLIPFLFYVVALVAFGKADYEFVRALVQGRSLSPWLLAMFAVATFALARMCYSRFRDAARGDSGLRGSRSHDTVIVAVVAAGLLVSSYAYGTILGDSQGAIDASPLHSTLSARTSRSRTPRPTSTGSGASSRTPRGTITSSSSTARSQGR